MGYDAVLMLGFGGPASAEEVRPFVLNVVRGRPVPPERIDAVVEQYRQIGGSSPFQELTRRQSQALKTALAERGLSLAVYLGFLFSPPSIGEIAERMVQDGVSRAVAIVMAPHRTEASFDRYVRQVREAADRPLQSPAMDRCLSVDFLRPWHRHPLFVEAVAARVLQALERLEVGSRQSTQLVFTAHSVPQEMSAASGYALQVEESAALVARSLAHANWKTAFQSRSGGPTQGWLGPDVRDVLTEAAFSGVRDVVVVPIGFVCDHVEVLFDLDIQAKDVAARHGVNMVRAATVGDHPSFISMLCQLVAEAASREDAEKCF